MIVYLDVIFAVNSLVNTFLLLCCCQFTGRHEPLWRVVVAGMLGGGYAVLMVLPPFSFLNGWFANFLGAAVMLLAAFGWGKRLLRMAVWFGLLSAAFAGILLLLTNVFSVGVYRIGGIAVYPISFSNLVLLAGISYCVISLALRGFARQSTFEQLRPVTICVQGKRQRFTALVDTGNVLHDPLTGKPVFVLDGRWACQLLPQFDTQNIQQPVQAFSSLRTEIPGLRLVPYHAVGVETGLLLAVKSDWILLGKKRLIGATVAISPSPLSGGAYQVIAGGD